MINVFTFKHVTFVNPRYVSEERLGTIFNKRSPSRLFACVQAKLSEESRVLYEYLPASIKAQLLADRDAHGNVQVCVSCKTRGAPESPSVHVCGRSQLCACPEAL